jgi:DNA-binding NtrC family response regulator
MANILLLDDDDQLRTALRRMLEEAGHKVIEADEGLKAIRLYRQHQVDLLISDLFMEGKEGLETIFDLHREFPHLRIVAMSGGDSKGKVDMLPLAKRFGAVKTLNKPFDKQVLLTTVEEVLAAPIEALTK